MLIALRPFCAQSFGDAHHLELPGQDPPARDDATTRDDASAHNDASARHDAKTHVKRQKEAGKKCVRGDTD